MNRARVEVEARLRPRERHAIERFREEQRVGVVFRTATEVEARSAGFGPGGGAVIVGLARGSPWRKAGLHYGDLILEAGGERVQSPRRLLEVLERAPYPQGIEIRYLREGAEEVVQAPVTGRAREVSKIKIPFLFSYERERRASETSALLGLFRLKKTPVAWELRLLWFFHFGGGEADRLEELDE